MFLILLLLHPGCPLRWRTQFLCWTRVGLHPLTCQNCAALLESCGINRGFTIRLHLHIAFSAMSSWHTSAWWWFSAQPLRSSWLVIAKRMCKIFASLSFCWLQMFSAAQCVFWHFCLSTRPAPSDDFLPDPDTEVSVTISFKIYEVYKLSAEWEILLNCLYSVCLFNLKSLLHGDAYSLESNTVHKHWVIIKNVFVPRCSCDIWVICLLQDWSLGNRPGEAAGRQSWRGLLEPVGPVPGAAH